MTNFYPEDIIEEVRINNDIVDVVSEYVRLEKKGKDYFGLCPFHREKTPSFSVAPQKQIYYCFGCGKGGNVIHFIMNAENLDLFVKSIKFLAERAKIQLPDNSNNADSKLYELKSQIRTINLDAARFYFNNLNLDQNKKAIKYLEDRNLKQNIIRKFGIGYSTQDWDLLYKHLVSKGHDEKVILKSGLVVKTKKGGIIDRFRNRIMFPIFDLRGNIIGFGGRVIDSSMPKYVNSPETVLYNKGHNLYGLNFAKSSGESNILIVEGYMDVLALHQSGIINAVASLGTALTERQGRLLKKYAEEVVISFDSDDAGQAATIRGLEILDSIGCNVKVLLLPQGKDPDDFIKGYGPEKFKELIHNSISLIEYKIKLLKKELNIETLDGKIKFLNEMASIIAKIDNRIEREMYIRKLAREYSITEQSLYEEVIKKVKKTNKYKAVNVDNNNTDNLNRNVDVNISKNEDEDARMFYHERILLALLCVDNSVYKVVQGKLFPEDFTQSNQKIAELIFDRLDSKKGITTGELLNLINSDDAKVFAKIFQDECNCQDNNKAALDIIKKMKFYKLDKRQQEILDILSNKSQQLEGDVEKLKQELKTIIMKKNSL